MEDFIKKFDASLLEVKLVLEYLKQFKNYTIETEIIEQDNGEINIISFNESVQIVFIKITNAKWWSIYRFYKDGTKYEQVDVIQYDETKDDGYNIIIKFSGHLEDDVYSYITCSSFYLLNNEVLKGWKKYRVVPKECLDQIQYCKSMNLTELILMTNRVSERIIKADEQNNIKTLSLKLDMD